MMLLCSHLLHGADYMFLCPTRMAARAMAKRQQPTFMYRFNHSLSFSMGWGVNYSYCEPADIVCHGSELPFVFHSVRVCDEHLCFCVVVVSVYTVWEVLCGMACVCHAYPNAYAYSMHRSTGQRRKRTLQGRCQHTGLTLLTTVCAGMFDARCVRLFYVSVFGRKY